MLALQSRPSSGGRPPPWDSLWAAPAPILAKSGRGMGKGRGWDGDCGAWYAGYRRPSGTPGTGSPSCRHWPREQPWEMAAGVGGGEGEGGGSFLCGISSLGSVLLPGSQQ